MDQSPRPKYRIVVTVRPGGEHDGLLRVDDALQQVLDFIRLADEAKHAVGRSQDDFHWYLKSASTNSPFTVEAVAEPVEANRNIDVSVREVKREASKAISGAMRGDEPPGWITPSGMEAIHAILRRNANGINRTDFDFDGEATNVEISHDTARFVLPDILATIEAFDATPARVAHGEVTGTLVSAGRWRGRPALLLMTPMYGTVWCVLTPRLMEQFGDATVVSAVWKGKRFTVYGRLNYWRGGKLSRVEAEAVTERQSASIDISSVIDSGFTAGLDPVEYIHRLHEGELG